MRKRRQQGPVTLPKPIRLVLFLVMAITAFPALWASTPGPTQAEGDVRGTRGLTPSGPGVEVAGNTGGATYSMPITLLPGRAGLTPQMALSYSSSARSSGPFGVGWMLNNSFVERIGPRGGVPTYDYHPDEPAMRDELIMNLNNMSARLFRGTDGAYYTEQETFLKISYHRYSDDPENARGGYWLVSDQSGMAYMFGYGFSGQPLASKFLGYQCMNQSQVRGPLYNRWYLDRIIDGGGNTITFHYLTETLNPPVACYSVSGDYLIPPTQLPYLSQVKYNGYSAVARPGPNPEGLISSIQPMADAVARRLTIDYENRPDETTSYRSGFEVKTRRRAQQIIVYAGLSRIRRYALNYQQSAEPGRPSLLSSVQEFGTDDSAFLPPTKFEYTTHRSESCHEESCLWQDQGEGSFVLRGRPEDPPVYLAKTVRRDNKNRSFDMGVRLADLNGDGCVDVIQGWHESGGSPASLSLRRAWISNCRGEFTLDARYDPPAIFEDETGRRDNHKFVLDHGFRLVDINGDGKPDLVRGFENADGDGDFWAGCPDRTSCREAWLNQTPQCRLGDQTPICLRWTGCAPPNDRAEGCRGLAWAQDNRFAPPEVFTVFRQSPRRNQDTGAQLVDINGDGLPDLVVSGVSARGSFKKTWINTGDPGRGDPGRGIWKEAPLQSLLPVPLIGEMVHTSLDLGARFIDVNGDGLPDVVVAVDYNPIHDAGCPPLLTPRSRLRAVWINTGDGWRFDGSDGLDGRRISPYVYRGAFAGIGGHVQRQDNYCVSDADNPVRVVQNGYMFFDVNGDGLTDIIARKDPYINQVLLNTGQGWEDAPAAYRAPVSVSRDISDWVEESRGLHELDWNGDGVSDLVQLYHNEQSLETHQRKWRNKSAPAGLLWKVTSPLGGTTLINYTPTSVLPYDPETTANPNPHLPMSLNVIKSITNDPGIGPVQETRYEFSQGRFYGDAIKQEFRGFGTVKTTVVGQGVDDPSAETVTTYLQDDWNKGRVEWTGVMDPTASPARLYDFSQSQYQCLSPGVPDPVIINCHAAGLPYRYVLTRQDRFTCEGQVAVGDGPLDPCRRTAAEFAYDNYGNVVIEKHHGIIGLDGDVGQFPGDEKTIVRTFSSSEGFTGLIIEEHVFEGIGQDVAKLLSQKRWSYDNPSTDLDCARQSPVPPNCLDGPSDHTRTIRKGILTGVHTGGVLRSGEPEPDPWRSINYKTDAYGNVIQVIDPRGFITAGSFRSADPLVDSYLPTSSVNALGQESTFRYDLFLRPHETDDPNGCTSASQYDGLGRLFSHTVCRGDIDVNGPSTQMAYVVSAIPGQSYTKNEVREGYEASSPYRWKKLIYDGFGRVIQAHQESEAAGKAIVTTTKYNKRGRVAETTIPTELADVGPDTRYVEFSAKTTRIAYDAIGRAVRVRAPDQTERVSEFKPGEAGEVSVLRKIISTDEEGKRRLSYHDAYGQPVRVEEKNSRETETYRTVYEYDKLGRLVSTTDAVGNVSRIFFNSLSQKVKMIDPDVGTWHYLYDPSGNVSAQTNAKRKVITFTYDGMNRLLEKIHPCSNPAECAPIISYVYDTAPNGKGRPAAIRDHAGTRRFEYDKKGRLTKTTYEVCRGSEPQEFAFVSEKHSPSDQLLEKIYPDGETEKAAYNARGLLQSLKIRRSGGDWETVADDITYNEVGKPRALRLGNGVQTLYTYYDAFHEATSFRLREIQTTTRTGRIQNLTYSYDKVGHITTVRGAMGLGDSFDVGQDFVYDDLYRLSSATWIGDPAGYGALEFSYSPIGNILTKDGRSYGYTDPAHAHAVTSVQNGSDTFRYAYDLNGNLTESRLNEILRQRFSYNRDDKLTVYRDLATNATTKYVYDDGGTRVYKINDPEGPSPQTTVYLENGSYVIKPDGGIEKYLSALAKRVLSPDGRRETYYFHNDALGSTSLITNSQQNIVEQAVYKPYGEIHRNEPRLGEPFGERRKFTGHEYDHESRLYYMGARYYDAILGRFISPDRVALHHEDPQDLNRYTYARNNPTTLVDLTGEKFSWVNFIIAVAGGALSGGVMTPVSLEIGGVLSAPTITPLYGFSVGGAVGGAAAGAVQNAVAQKWPAAGRILNIAASALAGGMGLGYFNASGWQGALASGATAAAGEANPFLGASVGLGFGMRYGSAEPAGRALGHGFSLQHGRLNYGLPLAGGGKLALDFSMNLTNLQATMGAQGNFSIGKGGSQAAVGISGFVDPRSGFFGPFLSAVVRGQMASSSDLVSKRVAIERLSFGIEYGLRSAAHLGHHLNYYGGVDVGGKSMNQGSYHSWISAHVIYSEATRPSKGSAVGQSFYNPTRPTKPGQSYRWVGAPVIVSHSP